MTMTKHAVPFRVGELYGGFAECQGLMRDDGDHLCLEFQTQDSVFGILKGEITQVRIPLKQLVAVTLKKGWLRNKLTIQAAQMVTLKDVPGMNQGRVKLSIARNDYQAAEELVAMIYRQGDDFH